MSSNSYSENEDVEDVDSPGSDYNKEENEEIEKPVAPVSKLPVVKKETTKPNDYDYYSEEEADEQIC